MGFSDQTNNTVPAHSLGTLAEFRISGRVQQLRPSTYAVTMESYRVGDGYAQEPTDILADMCPTLVEAQQTLRQLMVALGSRIRERGGIVLTVETNYQSGGG